MLVKSGEANKSRDPLENEQEIICILESISDGFFCLDHEGRFVYINKEAERLFSYVRTVLDRSVKEYLGVSFWDSFPKYKDSSLFEICEKVMSTKVPAHFETKMLYSDTEIEAHIYPFREGLSIYFRDITERKQAERDLVDANTRISSILESITDGFFSVDNEWCFTYVNTAAEEIFNKKRSEILGKNLWEVYSETPPTFAKQYRETMISGKTFTSGGYSNALNKWVRVTVYRAKNGLTFFLRDKTAQVKNQEQLKTSEERFYKAFHNSSSAMVIQRPEDNTYIEVNKAFEKITGYLREEVIGRSASELNIWLEEEEQQAALMQNFILQGSASNAEIKIRTKKGKTRIVLVSADIIAANDEKYILIVAQDITELRNLEEEIRRLDRLNSVAQLAASISHEVRNPMTIVRGFLQLLTDKPQYKRDKEIFQLMIDEIDRANEMITGYLSLTKKQGTKKEMKNLNKIINDLYPLLLGDATKSDKNILLNQQPVPDLKLNKKEVHQLVLNLARNGLEAMSPGGKLIISTFVDNEDVVLAVKDEGTGIPAEILERIGAPFITSKENGTGMGLPVCYSIAARHNAKIQVETGIDGTEFLVRFRTKEGSEQ